MKNVYRKYSTERFESFRKGEYTKKERFDELLALQKEMVRMAFPGYSEEEVERARIWDVLNHFEEENRMLGYQASSEVDVFRKDCKAVGQLIAAEISGGKGEGKAFRRLTEAGLDGIVLRNLEVENAEGRTEIDILAINAEAVFVIEVKNTRRSVFIDELGDQYKVGEYTRLDSNLGRKMSFRKRLVEEILANAGFEGIDVVNLVVFTDNRIEVQNQCHGLEVTFLGRLPYIIKGHKGAATMSDEQRSEIASLIADAACEKHTRWITTSSTSKTHT